MPSIGSVWTKFPPLDPWETSVFQPAHTLSQKLVAFPCRSGRRKDCSLVRQPFDIIISRVYDDVGQFHNHREDRGYAKIWARISGNMLL